MEKKQQTNKRKLNVSFFGLGESYVKMKGCFSDSTCSNTECVDTSKPKKMNFCCCTGNMCNSQFKHMPTTTMPPKIDDTIVNGMLIFRKKMCKIA